MRERVWVLVLVLASLIGVVAVRTSLLREGRDDGQAGTGPDAGGLYRLVELSGPPRSKGLTHGRELAEPIRARLERLRPEDAGVADFVIETCGRRLLPHLPGPLREELEGIADGAGITLPEALFLTTCFDLAEFGLLEAGRAPLALDRAVAVGPGPEVLRRFRLADLERTSAELVVLMHEDADPPLMLVALPGMVGGLLGLRGECGAAPWPIPAPSAPVLNGVAWPILLRALLEDPAGPGAALPARVTRPVSIPAVLPGHGAGTLNAGPNGGTWYEALGGVAPATEGPVTGSGSRIDTGRSAGDSARALREEARRLLASETPEGCLDVRLRAGRVTFARSGLVQRLGR